MISAPTARTALRVGFIIFALTSCAALGGSSRLVHPQAVLEARLVGLAPISTDLSIRDHCADADAIAEERLLQRSRQTGGFELLPAGEWLRAPGYYTATTAQAFLERARARGLDAVLFCRVRSSTGEKTEVETDHGWSLNFGPGPLIKPYEEVTGTSTVTVWLGAIVDLELRSPNGDLLARSTFDTHLGKSYWNSPSAARQVGDAAEGAMRPLLRARRGPGR